MATLHHLYQLVLDARYLMLSIDYHKKTTKKTTKKTKKTVKPIKVKFVWHVSHCTQVYILQKYFSYSFAINHELGKAAAHDDADSSVIGVASGHLVEHMMMQIHLS